MGKLKGALTTDWFLGRKTPGFVLVTGSDRTHAKQLMRLLGSIKKFEPRTTVILYDLGLTRRQLWNVRRSFSCKIRKFRYELYPPYLNIRVAKGEYAWKPVIINEVAGIYGGIVCWMDADNRLAGTLAALHAFVGRHGFYSPTSSGTVADWTHKGMLDWFGLPPDWHALTKCNFNGACVAFDTHHPEAMALIAEWGRLALIKDCIAPPGSSRANHRQDQALLTVLAYRSGLVEAPAERKLGFRTHANRPRSGGRRTRELPASG